jgi:hypothetical protein
VLRFGKLPLGVSASRPVSKRGVFGSFVLHGMAQFVMASSGRKVLTSHSSGPLRCSGRLIPALGLMETMMAAGLILSPIGLIICALIPAFAIFILRSPQLSARRLIAGYIGALFALALVVAASSYVSPEKALSVWHVPADHYWAALRELFIGTFVVAAFASIVGISFVGLPVLVKLSKSGKATAPWLILTSAAISAAAACIAFALMHSSSNITFLSILGLLVVTHIVLALGFSLAAKLPWAFRPKS